MKTVSGGTSRASTASAASSSRFKNYARQLDSHEQQLAGLRDRQADLQKKKSALEADMSKMIDGLSF